MHMVTIAPGVVRRHGPGQHQVTYVGAGASLVAAGVVRDEQLPAGRSTCATWLPDGSRARRGGGPSDRPGRMQVHLRHQHRCAVFYVTRVLDAQQLADLEAEESRSARSWYFPCSAHVEAVPQ